MEGNEIGRLDRIEIKIDELTRTRERNKMKTDKELKKLIVGEFIKEATITTRDGEQFYFVDFSFDKGLLNKVADNIISKIFEE